MSLTKEDILRLLEPLSDDTVLVFNNSRNHVLEDILNVHVDEVHKVTELGRKRYGVSIGEYVYEDDPKYLKDLKEEDDWGYPGYSFERETTKVIVFDWLEKDDIIF